MSGEDTITRSGYYPGSASRIVKKPKKRLIMSQSMVVDVDPFKVRCSPLPSCFDFLSSYTNRAYTLHFSNSEVTKPSQSSCTTISSTTQQRASTSSFNGLVRLHDVSMICCANGVAPLSDMASSWSKVT